MLLRGSTFISSVFAGTGAAEPRYRFGAKAVQIYSPGGMVWSKKPLIVRNAPYTIEAPHLGQLEIRERFGDTARAHKGEKGFREGLPAIAYYIKTELRGKVVPDRMAPEDYPSKKFRTFHTLEQVKRMLREKRAALRAPGALPVPPGAIP
jgi:hypothetical protein